MLIGRPVRWSLGVACLLAIGAVASGLPGRLWAQAPKPGANEPARPSPGAPEPAPPFADSAEMKSILDKLEKSLPGIDTIKPLPETAIPDDPPHEGAMIDYPITIHPPDLIIVEFLEALPSRPISGDHLVRPDGTISLGYYGDVHVRGLTTSQAKVKIILHMRPYLTDEALGLVGTEADAADDRPGGPAPPGADQPGPDRGEIPPLPKDGASPFDLIPKAEVHGPGARRSAATSGEAAPRLRLVQLPKGRGAEPRDEPKVPARDPRVGGAKPVANEPSRVAPRTGAGGFHPRLIPPADSDRVLVDTASYNSQSYYLLGGLVTPGRFPWTGRETVLDALQYGGGLAPDADPKSLKLVRPARGGKPVRTYPIDLEAITDRGDAKSNLQLFPGDRLIVAKKAVAEALAKPHAATAP